MGEKNLLLQFQTQIFEYITGSSIQNPHTLTNLIKQNKDRLDTLGDFSFSNKRNVWMSHIARQETTGCDVIRCCKCVTCNDVLFIDDDVMSEDDADAADASTSQHSHYIITKFLVAVSNSVALPVARIKIAGDWCNVFLDRRKCIEKILTRNESVGLGQECERLTSRKRIKITSDEGDEQVQNVTDYRLKLLERVTKNLINESDYFELCENEKESYEIHFTTKSNKKDDDTKKIMSGIVIDPKNSNKRATMTAEEYIK